MVSIANGENLGSVRAKINAAIADVADVGAKLENRRTVFHPREFGAGGGVVSDDDAIDLALAAIPRATGGGIYIDQQYTINREHLIDKSNVHLVGTAQHGNPSSSGKGAYFVAGANLGTGSMFKYVADPDERPTRGCSIVGVSFDGDDRSYTMRAAVNIDQSDLFYMSRAQFRQIRGSGITASRSIRSVFSVIDMQKCGTATDNVFDIQDADTLTNRQVQGKYSNIMIESSYGLGLNVGDGNSFNHFINLGFETEGESTRGHMVCAADNCMFTNLQLARNGNTTEAVAVFSGNHCGVSTVTVRGLVNGQKRIEVSGNYNVVSDVRLSRVSSDVRTDVTIELSGDLNMLRGVNNTALGGVVLSGDDNKVEDTLFTSCGMTEVLLSGSNCTSDNHKSVANVGDAPSLEISGAGGSASGVLIRSSDASTEAIKISGASGLLSHWRVDGCDGNGVTVTGAGASITSGVLDETAKHGIDIQDVDFDLISGVNIKKAGTSAGTWNGINLEATSNETGPSAITNNVINEGSGTLANGIFANDNAGTEYYRNTVVTGNAINVSGTAITFPNTLSSSVVANNVT